MQISLGDTEIFIETEAAFVGRPLIEGGKGGTVFRWMWFRVTVS